MEADMDNWVSYIQKNYNTPKRNTFKIIDVYSDNFVEEIKHLSLYLDKYNYIGMDTEYPGTVFKINSTYNDHDFYYKSISTNANNLKLIQLGLTLYNEKGENPEDVTTWQFNFHFDTSNDRFSADSLSLLINSGINFDKLKNNGISHSFFGEYFMTSGLILNPNIHWISYHGSSDFAYLLKSVLGKDLPEKDKDFTKELTMYFPSHYDIRILIAGREQLKGGLNKLAQNLNILRTGDVHQSGSDSLVTGDAFFTLIKIGLVDAQQLREGENIIYGIDEGEDNEETYNYTLFTNQNELQKNTVIRNNNGANQQTALNINTPMYIPNMTSFSKSKSIGNNLNFNNAYDLLNGGVVAPMGSMIGPTMNIGLIENQMMMNYSGNPETLD